MATEVVQLKVSGLMCSFCTMSVETALKRYSGIKSVMVNLVHGIVLVEADTSKISREAIANAVEKLGYNVASSEIQQYATDEALFSLIKRRGLIGMLLAMTDLLIDPLNILSLTDSVRGWISFAIATFVLFWVGYPILRKTLLAIAQRVINANVLLSAGAWGSYIVGILSLFNSAWPNFLPVASWLMALHLFFGYFKLDTRKKASDAVRKLLSLQPAKARVKRGDQIIEVLTKDVSIGETVEVKPGERIPLDGVVIHGSASVDESSFTGESVPTYKKTNSEVIGGTLNLDGALSVKVSKPFQESFLSQIVKLMSQISERKPSIELLADKLMNFYGPVVLVVAVVAFLLWFLVTGDYFYSVLVLLTTIIMGYPCALGITTPMLAAIAGGKGISIGLLVKASEVFHGLSKVNTVAFDKTGTITHGKPTVTDVHVIDGREEDLLSILLSVEQKSEHPLGQAIQFFAKTKGAVSRNVNEFKAIPGRGVTATVDGELIMIGSPRFTQENGVQFPMVVIEKLNELSNEGKTVIAVVKNRSVLGLIALQDTPRPDAKALVQMLKANGFHTVMLTGDSLAVAQSIAKQIGIDEVKAELLPHDKVKVIESIQANNKIVAMVGDGINDAPALAQSNVGIAIAAGTDVAIESAGVILVSDKLIDVFNAIVLGRSSYRIMTGNVIVAVIFNIIGMLMAALGYVTPMLAIIFMIVSIFAILLNTLRVRTLKFQSVKTGRTGQLQQVNFKVSNMVCEGCAEKITDMVSQLPGVDSVKPKVMRKQVTITFQSNSISSEKIKSVMTEAGYNAIEI